MTQFGTLHDHIRELKKAVLGSLFFVILSLAGALFFYQPLVLLLLRPLPEGASLVFLSPESGFTSILSLSLWVSVIGSTPIWGFFLVRFAFPALLPGEKQLIFPVVYGTITFGVLGCIFAYFAAIPTLITYFWSLNETIGKNLWAFSSYLDFVTTLILSTVLLFECAFLLLLLTHFEIVSTNHLQKGRKGFIFATLIIAALLTPPDLFSQLISSSVLILCYELSICYAKTKKKKAEKSPLTKKRVTL